MTTIASIAGEIVGVTSWDYDDALTFAIACARDLGVEAGIQEGGGRAALVEIDEDTARKIWEDACVAAETAIW